MYHASSACSIRLLLLILHKLAATIEFETCFSAADGNESDKTPRLWQEEIFFISLRHSRLQTFQAIGDQSMKRRRKRENIVVKSDLAGGE
jgi:hypothetical protein